MNSFFDCYFKTPFITDIGTTRFASYVQESDTLYENRIFVHPTSGYFSGKLYVELYQPKTHELLYKTAYKTKNGKEYKLITKDSITERLCPRCKNRSLYVSEIINWD